MSVKYPFLQLLTVNAPYVDEVQARVDAVIHSGRYIGGQEVELFEEKLRKLTGSECAVGVSNGLDALRLSLHGYMAMGVMRPGDEIIVPTNTFIASILAISDAGLTPVLADADIDSNLDIRRGVLEKYLTQRTRGIMPVHLYGRVCWTQELADFAKAHSLKIIEDNAQAIGASIVAPGGNGRIVTGNLSDAAAFSFYPTKNIGAMGDAGAVTTSDHELAATVRTIANYGSDTRYHNIIRGYNCRLDPVQAAVLNAKLPYLDQENNYRREIAETYLKNIDNPCIILPPEPTDPQSMVWHQFVVHVKADSGSSEARTEARKKFTDYLDANSIGWNIHYPVPAHLQPCYAECLDSRKVATDGAYMSATGDARMPYPLPVAERLCSTCVSLPVTRCTSMHDAEEISALINAYSAN